MDGESTNQTAQLKQPWKEWLGKEIEARTRAEQNPEEWEAQEKRRLEYETSIKDPKHKSLAMNKAG